MNERKENEPAEEGMKNKKIESSGESSGFIGLIIFLLTGYLIYYLFSRFGF